MTGVAFVAYMGRISGLDKNTALSRAHDVLQSVGVDEERYRKIAEYSTGMRQKVKLAQPSVISTWRKSRVRRKSISANHGPAAEELLSRGG